MGMIVFDENPNPQLGHWKLWGHELWMRTIVFNEHPNPQLGGGGRLTVDGDNRV